MYRLYKKLQSAVVWLFMAIVYFSMVFIPVILCAQVICRKFLSAPILGAEELAGFAFTAMVLFGSAIVCYRKQYIVVDVFVKKIKGRMRNVLTVIADIMTLVCYSALLYCFYTAIPSQSKFITGIFGVPKSAYAIALIVVFSFMCICTIEYIVLDVKAIVKGDTIETKGAFG